MRTTTIRLGLICTAAALVATGGAASATAAPVTAAAALPAPAVATAPTTASTVPAAATAPTTTSAPAALPAADARSYVFDFNPIVWPSYHINSPRSSATIAYWGWSIQNIQSRLNSRGGAKLKVDGSFGHGTRAAVIKFQRSRGLAADGYVGPKTWRALGLTKEIIR